MLSIVIPWMRKKGFDLCVKRIKEGGNEDIIYEIVAEEDENRIGCAPMLNKLVERSKYDIVLFLQDDSIPCDRLLSKALNKMREFEGGWGLVALNDGTGKGRNLATHWMAHKKLLPHLGGYFLHEGYKHAYSDNELALRCQQIGRYKYCEEAFVIHNHPVLNGNQSLMDDDYRRIYSAENTKHDISLFNERRNNGWK